MFPKGKEPAAEGDPSTVHGVTSHRVQIEQAELGAGNGVLQQSRTWQAMNQGWGLSREPWQEEKEMGLGARQGPSRRWGQSQGWRPALLWCYGVAGVGTDGHHLS